MNQKEQINNTILSAPEEQHKCGLDCSSVHANEVITIKWIDDKGIEQRRDVCPCCIDHPQGEVGDVYDCKNVFWEGYYWDKQEDRHIRRSTGQCMCYSPVHGKRKRR